MTSPDGETIRGGHYSRGGHYRLEKGFDRGHYLREDYSRGKSVYKKSLESK